MIERRVFDMFRAKIKEGCLRAKGKQPDRGDGEELKYSK